MTMMRTIIMMIMIANKDDHDADDNTNQNDEDANDNTSPNDNDDDNDR